MKASVSKSLQTTLFYTLSIFALLWNTYAWSHSIEHDCNNSEKVIQEKLYVTPEQIEVTEDGILFYDAMKDILILYQTLSYDKNGLYLKSIVPTRGPCGVHNLWCKYCGGCGVLYCPMKCECPNGVGG